MFKISVTCTLICIICETYQDIGIPLSVLCQAVCTSVKLYYSTISMKDPK